MEQLFLIEILVETIYFNSVGNVPQKKQINIVATFGNFANLEIRYDGLGGVEESSKSTDIDFSTGKSYLFASKAASLLSALQQYPLELTVGIKNSSAPIGKATIEWTHDFIDMVQSCDGNVGYITPTSVRNIFPMKDKDVETGHIDAFVRLSCFGKSIQTQFQILHGKDVKNGISKTQYLFKSTNAATTFQCQRYGLGTSTDILPVAPIFNPVEIDDRCLTSVYQARSASQCGSVVPSVFDLDLQGHNVQPNSIATVAMLNERILQERPNNKKFVKLEDIQWSRKLYTDEELTAENINKLLCQDHDCPAVKKFKEFGIGPLATGKGLGTLYGQVEPPVSYGVSHVHGKTERYGPYGVYYRPKGDNQTFEPKRSTSEATNENVSSNCSKCSSCSCHAPLRLSGGAPMEESDRPSPLYACKELMKDFDKVLVAYKKALGPCGHASCPFAENLIAESCKIICPGVDENHPFPMTPAEIVAESMSCPDSDTISTCGVPSCPYGRKMTQPVEEEFKLGQIKSACGDPTCPYVKRRCQLDDEEADEAAVLLANLPKNCGAVKCPFAPEPTLPPIHWDCPDPLPKGPCKNRNCPISRKEKLAACIFQPPVSPCYTPSCPYAVPPPCNFPGCPFGLSAPCTVPGCPYSQPALCTDPRCPLSSAYTGESTSQSICDDPKCRNGSVANVCSDPRCPVSRNRKDAKESKGSVDSGASGDGATEVCSGDTMEPCTPNTCKAKGGDLDCVECRADEQCPCSATESEREPDEEGANLYDRPVEIQSSDLIEPCTPYSCSKKGEQGALVCDECYGDKASHKANAGAILTASESGSPCPCSSPHVCLEYSSGNAQFSKKKEKRGWKTSKSAPNTTPEKAEGISAHKAWSADKTSSRNEKKRKRRSKFVYDTGDAYPGVKIGHRECVTSRSNVPANMGWLWNVKPPGRLKPRRGWKPGALTKSMAATIVNHRLASGIKPLIAPPPPKVTKKKARKMNAYGIYESDSDLDSVAPKPTLQIKKKDGCYMITMNPLKDPYTLQENENPYMDCSPLQFRISKKPPPPSPMREEDAESSCCCLDNKSSSSDSELDIEFTPPAGILHPEKLRKKKNVIHIDTQYCLDDTKPETGEILQLQKKEKGGKKGKGGKGRKGKGKGGKKGKKGKKK